MQVSELVGPMLSVLRPEDKPLCVANPRPFGGVTRLLRSLARARFRDVRSRSGELLSMRAMGSLQMQVQNSSVPSSFD